jgi:FAD/FMN-containing dehydrogenase
MAPPSTPEFADRLKGNALRAANKSRRRVPKRARKPLRAVARFVVALLLFGIVVSALSFFRVHEARVSVRPDSSVRVTEVTHLYPVVMRRVVAPRTVEKIAAAVKSSPGPISIGGGRNSMGGQTATPDGLQIDMRNFHGVVAFDSVARTITVHSGTRWREVQEAVDKSGLAVKIMQTYNTFTVGGALSVNAHGRYIGQGPLVRSVRGITLVLADGQVVTASRTQNPELFFGAIGGYGALGVIADVTLDLAVNSHIRREDEKMPVSSYFSYFRKNIRDDSTVIFHNADMYPPSYESIHVVSYRRTTDPVTVNAHLLPKDQAARSHRMAYSMITSWPGGHWLREHAIDPILFRDNPVTWRNYEASYDISELEPDSRDKETYVLQEYFVPADSFDVFVPRMRKILREHDVNAVNVSVRHALPDSGTFLAWAPNEVFAFVLYYKQGTDAAARREVGAWTRELITAAIASGGRYYLPYQPVATRAQFARAYPRSSELFAVKRRVDPSNKFTNTLWDLYEPAPDGSFPSFTAARMPATLPAETRISLDSLHGYARNESAEWIRHPEWDLVYSSDAYARWLAAGKRPSGFPYVASVGTFWRAYQRTLLAARNRYSFPIGNHIMLGVIGLSTAIEYGLKGAYENIIGRLSELDMPRGGTEEDRYAAQVAARYVNLIEQRGWYEFGFADALRGLWTTVPTTGPGMFRKWERRFALSVGYGIKSVYAAFIGLGTRSAYSADEMQREIVVVGWNDSIARSSGPLSRIKAVKKLDRGYTLLSIPRYNPFRDALAALSDYSSTLRIAELSGAEIVAISGTAPRGWEAPPRTQVVLAHEVPTDGTRSRILILTSARDVLDVLHALRSEGKFQVEHVYDY